MIGVVSGEKIGKQFTILVNRIDRVTEKSRIAAKLSYRLAIGCAIATNENGWCSSFSI